MTVPPSPGAARRYAVVLLQFGSGVALVAVLGVVVWWLIPAPKVPPGWQLFRPPRDTLVLARVGNEVWAGGPDGLFAMNLDGSGVAQPIAVDQKLEHVTSISAAAGDVWVGHAAGASRWDGGAWHAYSEQDGLPDKQVWAVRKTSDGTIWVGTERGLAQRVGDEWHTWTARDGLAADAVTVIFEDSAHRLWVGNGLTFAGGLSVIESGKARAIARDRLPHIMVNAIAEDARGGIWVGTGFGSRGGACRLKGEEVRTLGKSDGLAGDKVRSLLVDHASGVWFGAEYDGAARLLSGAWTYVTKSDGLAGNEVKSMIEDDDGNLWFGTEDGVSRCQREVCGAQSSVLKDGE